jgi:uncharacterized protein (DUF1499 family)
MRLIKGILFLLVLAIVLLAGGVVLNRLPLNEPPGMVVRLYTYLNTHVAETGDGSPFPELRTRRYSLGADALYAKIKEAIARLPRWRIVESSDERREIHTVVTSLIFRFEDDVAIAIVPAPNLRPAVTVRAVSRVGKGDLGANTRHILDLYDMLEQVGAHGEVERMGSNGLRGAPHERVLSSAGA